MRAGVLARCGCVVAVFALALSGCTTSGSGAQSVAFETTTAAAKGGLEEVHWVLSKEPAVLDPDKVSNTGSNTILANVCERLMQVQPDLSVRPGLASSASWTGPRTVTFTLRSGVTFHDGSRMDAQAVVWSMRRHMADGAEESDEYANVRNIEATGPLEVTVRMKQRDAVFLQAMAGNGGIVYSPTAVKAAGERFGGPGTDDACSGPYRVGEWRSGTSLTLRRFDGYWDQGRRAKTKTVEFTWADENAVTNALLGGEVQGAYLDTASAAVPLLGNSDFTVAQGPATNAWSAIPTKRGVLSDVRVRRALSLALDRSGVARAGFGDLAQPAKTPLGQGAWGYEKARFKRASEVLTGSPAQPTKSSLTKAAHLIREAGANGDKVVIASDGQPVRNVIANGLASAARKIGLKPHIVVVPSQQYGDFYSDQKVRAKADLFLDEYYISKSDPVGFYKNGASDSGLNYLGFSDLSYDRLVSRAKAAVDDEERCGLAIELQKRWTEQMLWIPVVQTPATVAMSSDVTGVVASAAYLYYPWAADLGAAGSRSKAAATRSAGRAEQ